jgi:HTH-type transcriptional regulator/antitoxin HigA
MLTKVIKAESDYKAALAEIEALVTRDPDVGTPEADRLDLLALLVEDYESKEFPIELPDPIEAIRFRMEQGNLTHRDLVPYIGSRSKVSEVLSGKRPLTLSMMRALSSALGIPAKVLIQEKDSTVLNEADIEWERFPLGEMSERGWIQSKLPKESDGIKDIIRKFFAPIGGVETVTTALYRRTSHIRSERSIDEYALWAWTARVMREAKRTPPHTPYVPGSVDLEFMKQIVHLSASDDGILHACKFLMEHGIAIVIEPHLPRTHLDGAALLLNEQQPIIGLTIRYDRIDNFWFCLMHELAHLSLHLDKLGMQFFDDLDLEYQDDPREQEADALAGEVLVPKEDWEKSAASKLRSPEAAESLAKKLNISPAIVAGKMRHEFKAFRLLNSLVGHRQVRNLFPNVIWEG